jgi:aspartate kinase
VDDIIQNEVAPDSVSVSFTVDHADLVDIRPVLDRALAELGSSSAQVNVDVGFAKVSAVGVGMRSHTGVAGKMFRALAEAGVKIHHITTSEIRISCILAKEDGEKALRAVHAAFGLGTGTAQERVILSR